MIDDCGTLDFLDKLFSNDKHDYILQRLKKCDTYDLREDEKLKGYDVVGVCRKCGKAITKDDVSTVRAITFTTRHLGPNANGILSISQDYECWEFGCKEL